MRRHVTADIALRLGTLFGTTPGFWMNLQKRYDLDVAEDELQGGLNDIQPLTGPV